MKKLLLLLRFTLSFIFLWAFFDKVFGLGFATDSSKAWITGASPTIGYLSHGTYGPFAGMFQAMAGNIITDLLFMGGLLGVGVALLLGIGTRIAAYSGSLMMAFIYLSAFPPKNNPVLDEHIVYIIVLMLLPSTGAFKDYSLLSWWKKQPIVKKFPILE